MSTIRIDDIEYKIPGVVMDVIHATTNECSLLRAHIEKLERGEYICKKCGLRKGSDHDKGDF